MDKMKYAEQFTKRFGQNGVIMFYVDDNTFGYTSYGKDKAWCERMRKIADALWDDFANAYAQDEEDCQLKIDY